MEALALIYYTPLGKRVQGAEKRGAGGWLELVTNVTYVIIYMVANS